MYIEILYNPCFSLGLILLDTTSSFSCYSNFLQYSYYSSLGPNQNVVILFTLPGDINQISGLFKDVLFSGSTIIFLCKGCDMSFEC